LIICRNKRKERQIRQSISFVCRNKRKERQIRQSISFICRAKRKKRQTRQSNSWICRARSDWWNKTKRATEIWCTNLDRQTVFILKGGNNSMDYDAIVVGAGLAGLVATTEIARAGKKVLVVDQEGEQSVGGQAWWSFGGLFLVNSPEQRRMGIKDSKELAWQDCQGTATYDRQD